MIQSHDGQGLCRGRPCWTCVWPVIVQLAEEPMNPHTDSDLLAYFGPSSGRRLPPNPRSEASNLILLY